MTAAERPLLVICGSTASGKTSLGLKLAGQFPLRLISADSMQVYRGMDIGTAKPEGQERERFALLDMVNPGQGFSAGRFARRAVLEAETAWKAGQIPTLVGGTGLYLNAVLRGMAEVPAVPTEIRQEVSLTNEAELAEELVSKDPEGAAKIDMKNPRRVQRAVEVLRATGRSLASWQAEGNQGALNFSKAFLVGLNPSKEALLKSVRQRLDESLKRGWLDEATSLAARYGESSIRSTGAIGYGELLDVAAGKLSLSEARALIETRTLQYARRQRTWFKREKEIEWFEMPHFDTIARRIEHEIQKSN